MPSPPSERRRAPGARERTARRAELMERLGMLDRLRREAADELALLGGPGAHPPAGPLRLVPLKKAAGLVGAHPATLRR